jgi:O-antigen/teichoic acid export membrane protein
MSGKLEIFKKMASNKVMHYLFSRYATYFIQFVNSLFIAVFLGPYYLGIWGFINLVIQYLAQINLGITYSVNAIASVHKNKEWYVSKVIGTSITMLLVLSLFVIFFFFANQFFGINIGDKYHFSTYAPLVCIIAVLAYFNGLFVNIFRIYGKLLEVIVNQSIVAVSMLGIIFVFKGEHLLWALVIVNSIAVFLSFLFFLFRTPVKLIPSFNWRLAKTIQIKGWHLFVYNTSFYLIMLSTRSFVSGFYSVSQFGFFTFSFSLSNAILMFLQSISFLIFPKLLNRFANTSNERIIEILELVRNAYITLSHALVHFAILLFPLFLLLFPKYQSATDAFRIISLTVVLYTNSFGYQGLLIARGKEKKLGFIAFGALCLNVLIATILSVYLKVPYTLVILSTLFTYFVYVYTLGVYGRKELFLTTTFFSIIDDIFPMRLFIPFFTSLCFIIFSVPNISFVIPLVLFFWLNRKKLLEIKKVMQNVIGDPNVIDI